MSKIALEGNASGTGTFTLASPNSSTDRTLDLPDASGVIDRLNRAGNVLQVVQTVKTSFFSLATQDAWTDVTGVSVAITPSSASNKILLFVSGEYSGSSSDGFAYLRILRDSTSIAIGDSRGSSNRVTMSAALRNGGGTSNNISRSFGCHILDAPNTTSSVTYKLQMLGTNNQPFCVGGSFDASDDNRSSVPTFITAMEIAG